MNDYNEYRSYGSYLGRVFALIVAFLLLVLAIWFVVRLADGDEDDEPKLGDVATAVTGDEDSEVGDSDSGSNSSEASDSSDVAREQDGSESGETSSISTDTDSNITANGDLPNTGPAELWTLLIVPGVVFVGTKALYSVKS